jgi:hypothetical protein
MVTGGEFDSGRIKHILINRSKLPMNTATLATPEPSRHLTPANPRDFSKELTNLAKIFTDESKYTRQDNNFDFKLVIFHDLCSRASVPEETKVKAYPTMLSHLALDHYYTNLETLLGPCLSTSYATLHRTTLKGLSTNKVY